MDGYGDDGLILQGKSADYLGVEGKLRFQGRLKALSEGGTIRVDETDLKVSGADYVTLYIAAATNFVDYRDVSANPDKRVKAVNGWASAWKMACWARLFNGAKAMDNLNYYIHNYVFDNLFAICSKSLQVDGSFGVSAAVAEMILQSHEDEIFLLPALPKFWKNGEVRGLCARGGFEVDIKWEKTRLISALILSRKGYKCRLRTSQAVDVFSNGEKIKVKRYEKSLIEFDTKKDEIYKIAIFIQGAEL